MDDMYGWTTDLHTLKLNTLLLKAMQAQQAVLADLGGDPTKLADIEILLLKAEKTLGTMVAPGQLASLKQELES